MVLGLGLPSSRLETPTGVSWELCSPVWALPGLLSRAVGSFVSSLPEVPSSDAHYQHPERCVSARVNF